MKKNKASFHLISIMLLQILQLFKEFLQMFKMKEVSYSCWFILTTYAQIIRLEMKNASGDALWNL